MCSVALESGLPAFLSLPSGNGAINPENNQKVGTATSRSTSAGSSPVSSRTSAPRNGSPSLSCASGSKEPAYLAPLLTQSSKSPFPRGTVDRSASLDGVSHERAVHSCPVTMDEEGLNALLSDTGGPSGFLGAPPGFENFAAPGQGHGASLGLDSMPPGLEAMPSGLPCWAASMVEEQQLLSLLGPIQQDLFSNTSTSRPSSMEEEELWRLLDEECAPQGLAPLMPTSMLPPPQMVPSFFPLDNPAPVLELPASDIVAPQEPYTSLHDPFGPLHDPHAFDATVPPFVPMYGMSPEPGEFCVTAPPFMPMMHGMAEPDPRELRATQPFLSMLGTLDCPSVGSAGHAVGNCKPCAFFHIKGCGNDTQCVFCHLCPAGEKKKRQKDKRHGHVRQPVVPR